MSSDVGPSIRTVGDVTVRFLSRVLGSEIAGFRPERIGTGLVGECHRLHLQYAPGAEGRASVIVKIAASDPESRQTGKSLKLYERESRFYSELAPLFNRPSLVKCFHTSFSEKDDSFYLVLEDVRPATIGNELAGASLQQARVALAELARLQTASMRSEPPEWVRETTPPSQLFMQQMWAQFLERYRYRVSSEHRRICERFLACFDNYVEEHSDPKTIKCLVHGDYRLDNMLFGHDAARGFAIVDWQTLSWGSTFRDVAYFLGCALLPQDRRAHGKDLLRTYFDALGPNPPFTFDECREGVRRQSFSGLGLAFVSPMILERTTRGDDMFLTMLERLVTQIADLNALDTLPEPSNPEPIRPNPEDEMAHPPGEDPFHNESWYFDAVDPEQDVGLWIRLGITPNQPGSWYTALICGPGRPTVAIVDYKVPTPSNDLMINTDRIKATHVVESSLDRYRVTLAGRGESFDDPASLMRGEHGRPVTVGLDLTWHTAGIPYQWQMATRYEIPCTVSGTINVDGDITAFSHAAGQRDHSWGPRDWWSSDWVWTAFHLDDGTHLHGVEVRPPGRPRFGVGYTQSKDAFIAELTSVVASEQVADDHLVRTATVTYSAAGREDVVLKIKPIGHGPLRLDALDGRVSYFPRSWAEVLAQDGRKGIGWIEWNLNEPRKMIG
jgi:hypothetical protein